MPFFRFHFDVAFPREEVVQRIQQRICEQPTFSQQFKSMWRGTGPNTDMFCGSVQDNVFKLRRNIYYRNDFLPAIKGRVLLLPNGSRVVVTMHMPFVTIVFLIGILVLMTKDALTRASAGYLSALVFFVTLALLGFIPEAVIAKRLITETVLGIKPG
jgi:hypothetical protein